MLRTTLLSLLLLSACRGAERVRPPRAEFLVAAGDSTYWVTAGDQGVRVRGSPIQLAHYGGRFYEIYVMDDDRSYTGAEIVGQELWRRDLISGDSALVFRDTAIAGLERWYARLHPGDRRLGEDEDFDGEPRISATSQLDVVEHLDGTAVGGIDVVDAKLDIFGGFFLLAQRPHGP